MGKKYLGGKMVRYEIHNTEAIEEQGLTDTETEKNYWVDYFDEIVDLLNAQDEEIKNAEIITMQNVRNKIQNYIDTRGLSYKDVLLVRDLWEYVISYEECNDFMEIDENE